MVQGHRSAETLGRIHHERAANDRNDIRGCGPGISGAGCGICREPGGAHNPAYTSSIQVRDQDREEREEHHEGRGEAAYLASQAKIDLTMAISA
jgi:hypothetical protein